MKSTHYLPFVAVALSLLLFQSHLAGQSTPTLTVLHNFTESRTDGSDPFGGLVYGKDGNLYGTTGDGGSGGVGTFFQLTPAGVLTTLHSFINGTGGASPTGGLVLGTNGNFYGTSSNAGGGGDGSQLGTVFTITPGGAYTLLHSFTNTDPHGGSPYVGLVLGKNGNFYGATSGENASIAGTIFSVTPGGVVSTLHTFSNSTGRKPSDPNTLVQGSDGDFYGTTGLGTAGSTDAGTIFRITASGAFAVLHSFTGHAGGAFPLSALIQGSDGNFYGTTSGVYGGGTMGTVFMITPGNVFTTLHNFNGTDGSNPEAALIQGSDGNFYGTTLAGGSANVGTIFSMTPAGVLTTLYSFAGSSDGSGPNALIAGGTGIFYGTTEAGGSHTYGTVFKLSIPPIITSATTATATLGKAFSYQITATDNPTSYGVGGLFKSVTVDQQMGLISGTPMVSGTKTLTLRATNANGTGSATLTLTIQGPPVITSADTATAQVGQTFSYQIKSSNSPTSYGVGGLRPGLSVNSKTGLISGTPTGAGTFTLTLKATNGEGSDTQSLTLTINPSTPVITSPDTASATVGEAFSYQIKATGNPTSFGAGGLFAGITVDPQTGLVSGTPTGAGTHTLDLRATNAGGTGTKTLTLTIQPN